MSEEMSEEMNVCNENSRKTCDLFSKKTAGKHVTCLQGKTVANLFRVFQGYIQRKIQCVYKENSQNKDKFFPFVSMESNE
jgi:hypothetical protein